MEWHAKSEKNEFLHIDHFSNFRIDSPHAFYRLTGIICTIGPSSRDPTTLVKMIMEGMNIARLNFSHGTHEYHGETIVNVREASEIVGRQYGLPFYPIGIALDTKGPEIRTGILENGSNSEVELKTGIEIKVTSNEDYKEKCSSKIIFVDYKNITKVVSVGNRLYVDDGLMSFLVKDIQEDTLFCQIENGGMLGSSKGVNIPGIKIDLPALSVKDTQDINFGLEQGVDMIFASFIRNAENVQNIREFMGERGKEIKIISKIENYEGVINIDEIIDESDGIMVARGDLGIEIFPEKVFLAQKMMIAKCNAAGKPVICATQMLESMVKKPRPTRAEVSDVANAVLDGADCVMLSGETAKGEYPVQALQMMHAICLEAETAVFHKNVFEEMFSKTPVVVDSAHAVAIAAASASLKLVAAAIVVLTSSGRKAQLVARYRPRCPVLVVTRAAQVARQAHLWRGLLPLRYPGERLADWAHDVDIRVQFAIDFAKRMQLLRSGSPVIIVSGAGSTSSLKITYVE